MSEFYMHTMKLLEKYENPQIKYNVLTVEEVLPLIRFVSRMAGHLDILMDENRRLDKDLNLLTEKIETGEGD